MRRVMMLFHYNGDINDVQIARQSGVRLLQLLQEDPSDLDTRIAFEALHREDHTILFHGGTLPPRIISKHSNVYPLAEVLKLNHIPCYVTAPGICSRYVIWSSSGQTGTLASTLKLPGSLSA